MKREQSAVPSQQVTDEVRQFEQKWDELVSQNKPDNEFVDLLKRYDEQSGNLDTGYDKVIERLKREQKQRELSEALNQMKPTDEEVQKRIDNCKK